MVNWRQIINKSAIVDSNSPSLPVVLPSNLGVVFDSGSFAPLCETMTSSTKTEVHNVLHCRQRKTEPPPYVKCTEIWWNLDTWFLRYACGRQTVRQTDRQKDADTLIAILCPPTGVEVINCTIPRHIKVVGTSWKPS